MGRISFHLSKFNQSFYELKKKLHCSIWRINENFIDVNHGKSYKVISDAHAANALKGADEVYFKRMRADYTEGFQQFPFPAKKQLMDWDQKVKGCHMTERDFFFLYRQILFDCKFGDKEVLPRITRQEEWAALRKSIRQSS